MGQTTPLDLQQSTLEEIMEGIVQVLVGVVGLLRDHVADEVVGDAGQYVSDIYSWCGPTVRAEGITSTGPSLRCF